MERVKEKVKDLVDVKRHVSLANFWADPGATLEVYHFTDGTAELMVKWLKGVSNADKAGTCRAVAGYRGVGKSHFLAVFAAITAHPELRAKIADHHVGGASQDLLRRHYPVVNVRRGTGPTLATELAEAAALQFDLNLSEIGISPTDILRQARIRTGDLPLILVVDTASDREGQVDRNDGEALSQIAEFCSSNDIFLAVALDDDIAGADGDNVSITRHFAIDYIDQEHLYRAVNARVFVKQPRKQDSIRSIYESIRNSIKGFRWSEERFAALYPLHPVSLEITPFVRRFVPNFSILNFASSAGEKILSRPADSLIGLEELFEAAESDLRKNEELQGAFDSFDLLQETVVEKFPVKDRHRIKLILKSLLLLSLDGTGTNAQEIAAALMLPATADDPVQETARILDSFAMALPDGIVTANLDGSSRSYCFRTGLDKHSAELAQWISAQPAEAIDGAFLNAIARRFPEFGEHQFSAYGRNAVRISLEWRGSKRRGLLIFGDADSALQAFETDPDVEWEIYFDIDMGGLAFEPNTYPARVSWRPDTLLPEERRVLLGLTALSDDAAIRSSFGEHLSTAEHAHSAAAARILERVLFESARLEIEGFDYNFTEQARNESDLASIMSVMLEPVFETRYSEHPQFRDLIGEDKVEHIVRSIFNGPDEFADEREATARTFGAPLGIVIDDLAGLRRAGKDELRSAPGIDLILELIETGDAETTKIDSVFEVLRQPPRGLCVEARRLLLAALTANGFIDLVTKDGNRINGRSLDLKIDWDALAGIARPREGNVSDETILKWAREITRSPEIDSLRVPEHRTRVIEALVDISSSFSISRKPASLGSWQEYGLNAAMWRDLSTVSENYERVIESVDETLVGSVELESCVGRISTSFGDKIDVFHTSQHSAARIEALSKFQIDVERIQDYVCKAENTASDAVEQIRIEVTNAINRFGEVANGDAGREVGYVFERFLKSYIELYCDEHSQTFSNGLIRSELAEILASDECKRLRDAFAIEEIATIYRPKLRDMNRLVENLSCKFEPSENLRKIPQCTCTFRIADAAIYRRQPEDLRELIGEAGKRLKEIVVNNCDALAEFLRTVMDDADAMELADELKKVKGRLDVTSLPQRKFDLLIDSLESITKA